MTPPDLRMVVVSKGFIKGRLLLNNKNRVMNYMRLASTKLEAKVRRLIYRLQVSALLMRSAEVWVSKVRWNWWEETRRFIVVQYPKHVFVVVAGRGEASVGAEEEDGDGGNDAEGSGANQPKAPRSMIQHGLLN